MDAKKILTVGADVLSKVSESHDRDSMLCADGAGATILEGRRTDGLIEIIGHKTHRDTSLYSQMLYMGNIRMIFFSIWNNIFYLEQVVKLYVI